MRKSSAFTFFAAWCTVVSLCLSPWVCNAAENTTVKRCLKYYPRVIRAAHYYVGPNAPVAEFMRQFQEESRCIEKAKGRDEKAKDVGHGIAQMTPGTAAWLHKTSPELQAISDSPKPYELKWAVPALIILDAKLLKEVLCIEWYYAYRAYNGGAALLNKEIKRADSCDHTTVASQCKRKILKLGKQYIPACEINIRYAERITKEAAIYRRHSDD